MWLWEKKTGAYILELVRHLLDEKTFNMKIRNQYKSAYVFVVLHAIFVILWNIVGMYLLSQNKQALGPTASWLGVILFFVLIVLYTLSIQKKYYKLFVSFVSIGAILGTFAIYGALTKEHSLWPSELWRYAGVLVNLLGVIGFALSIKAIFTNNTK